jgi:hypothetical protein
MTGTCFQDFSGVCLYGGANLSDSVLLCAVGRRNTPAPTKLYLPIVSIVAALSKRKESFVFDLCLIVNNDIYSPSLHFWHRMTHLARIFRYATEGVRRSAGMVAHRGTRFGGLGNWSDLSRTSRVTSRVGSMLTYIDTTISHVKGDWYLQLLFTRAILREGSVRHCGDINRAGQIKARCYSLLPGTGEFEKTPETTNVD